MKLKVLLPHQVFTEVDGVKRIVAETPQGSFGVLPHRLDCVAVLVAGILTYESETGDEIFVAIDEGVMVKAGNDVLVSVRNAIGGMSLGELREAVEREFINIDEGEKQVRAVLAKLESGFVRRFAEYHRG
ncbi:MAG: F0F1 ATP synthase subunit epsilon [Proteobacteria bacterium]|nr:F0F1 ATP synthase subunit epsilon [Pseudomonadota bacterium]